MVDTCPKCGDLLTTVQGETANGSLPRTYWLVDSQAPAYGMATSKPLGIHVMVCSKCRHVEMIAADNWSPPPIGENR